MRSLDPSRPFSRAYGLTRGRRNPLLTLLADGRPGVVAVLSPSAMWQDSVRTVPVGPGDPVRVIDSAVPGRPGWLGADAAHRPIAVSAPATGVRNFAAGAAAVTNPVFWPNGTFLGAQVQVVGAGIIDGEYFADVRMSGTPSNNENRAAYMAAAFAVPTSAGQDWSALARISLVGGSTANFSSVRLGIREEPGVGTSNGPSIVPSSSEQTLTVSRTVASGSSVYVWVQAIYTPNAPIDITIRIRGLRLERGTQFGAYQANFSPFHITEAGARQCWGVRWDGVDDRLVGTADLDLSAQTRVTLMAGLEKRSDTNSFTALSHGDANAGGLELEKAAGVAQWSGATRSPGILRLGQLGVAAPDTAVVALTADRTLGELRFDYRGLALPAGTVNTLAGALPSPFRSAPVAIGARSTGANPFPGTLWGGLVVAPMTDAERIEIAAELAARTPGIAP